MKKYIALFLALVMIAACFVGCGKKEASDMAAIKKAGKIVVGITDYAPMDYKDENGEWTGFDAEFARLFAKELDVEIEFFVIADWGKKFVELETKNIDCVWNGFTANTADEDGVQRAEKVDFSYNYMENRQVVVVKKGSGITSAADLSGKLGAAEGGSAGETYGKSFEGATIKGFLKQTDCLFEVKSGTAAFCVLDAQLAKSYCGKGDYADLEIVEALSSDVEYYAIGFKKGSELTANVNKQLEKLAKDGTIAKLAEKYGVANTAITDFADQK